MPMPTVDDFIAIFGSQGAVAAAAGVGSSAVSMWRRRGIPAEHLIALARGAKQRGVEVDLTGDAPTVAPAAAT